MTENTYVKSVEKQNEKLMALLESKDEELSAAKEKIKRLQIYTDKLFSQTCR